MCAQRFLGRNEYTFAHIKGFIKVFAKCFHCTFNAFSLFQNTVNLSQFVHSGITEDFGFFYALVIEFRFFRLFTLFSLTLQCFCKLVKQVCANTTVPCKYLKPPLVFYLVETYPFYRRVMNT